MRKAWILGAAVLSALTIAASLGEIFPPRLGFEGAAVKVEIGRSPFGVTASGDAAIEDLGGGVYRLTGDNGHLEIPLAPGEAIYGLTERIVDDVKAGERIPEEVGGLDRVGEVVTMWVRPTISACAPFYISSEGYGMLVEGTWPGVYDIGKTDPEVLRVGWKTGAEGFSCLFFEGDCLEVLDKYTRTTGRPFLPPPWVFLPLKWRDQVARNDFAELDGLTVNAEVADDILSYEKLGLPVGIYMIDRPWAEGRDGYGNFEWDPRRFPNGDEMVARLHGRGWRVLVWGAPWAIGHRPSDFGFQARIKGFKKGTRCLDYTDPRAVAWHVDKISRFVGRSGVDGWKLDRSEEYNPSSFLDVYHDGRSGVEVHNDYPRMYIKTYYDGTGAVRGDDFVLVPRAGYTGTQAWSVVWGGDTRGSVPHSGGRVSTDLGLRSAIISLQRMAFMGFPVWGSDTGGYQNFIDREVFARWIEFSCFCPFMEIGGQGSHEPWNMPGEPSYDEEMIEILKRYAWMHAKLAGYSHDLAGRASETGNPIVHPLVMDWPGDPKVRDKWDEYMYGPAFLVAPVWKKEQREREVYLPEGEWIDLWDGSKTHEGPATIEVEVPLDTIPVFVRAEYKDMVPGDLFETE